MIPEIDRYYQGKEEPVRSCLLTLRHLILKQSSEVAETRKWAMPCFTYKKKMFCFLWTDKQTNEPYILMVEGTHLKHPELEKGNRSRMKILRIDSKKDIPVATINTIMKDALALYKNGIIKF